MNEQNLQPPFQPNDGDKKDPRINRKGRPKSFDAWRKMLQSIMDEAATDGKGEPSSGSKPFAVSRSSAGVHLRSISRSRASATG